MIERRSEMEESQILYNGKTLSFNTIVKWVAQFLSDPHVNTALFPTTPFRKGVIDISSSHYLQLSRT